MDVFATCSDINDYLDEDDHDTARNSLIKLLDYLKEHGEIYPPVVNHLIRRTGLLPYMEVDNAHWQDRFVHHAFAVDIGQGVQRTLHREQSRVLKKLLVGNDIAISAPTSFGKSFILDALIALTMPTNAMIIVPTIALTDEIRRRLQNKFGDTYRVITTHDVELSEKNIFVFPQERAIGYLDALENIDLLVVDEFYKASEKFDKERSSQLQRAVLKLAEKAKQRYFLAPNISSLRGSPITADMEFIRIDTNTVNLNVKPFHKKIRGDNTVKGQFLSSILKKINGKTIIYAGTYTGIDQVSVVALESLLESESLLLSDFSLWLSECYAANWTLESLVRRGCGIHNGRMHRSLSQIQVRLFEEEEDGLNNLISTSSIIEGVNTSAKNVIVWRNKNGSFNLKAFDYKNILGRAGRMFKHFVGDIYVLENPPQDEEIELSLDFPDRLLGDLDEEVYKNDLSNDQIAKIIEYKTEMRTLIGAENFNAILRENSFQTSDTEQLLKIARNMSEYQDEWRGFAYLNSDNSANWDTSIYKVLNTVPGGWEVQYSKYVAFVRTLSGNWQKSIPELLSELEEFEIDIEKFFQLERSVTFKLASSLSDISILYNYIIGELDISPFIHKASHAFLPSVVYQLEEYGLPRMLSKKIQKSGIIDLHNQDLSLHTALQNLLEITQEKIIKVVPDLLSFDHYILHHFYEGLYVKKSEMES